MYRRRNTFRRRSNRITKKAYLEKLKINYTNCLHDNVNGGLQKDYTGHTVTYGEMSYNGITNLYRRVNTLNPNINTFIDIGSGRGKLCLYMASYAKIKKTIGIELVEERYQDALKLKEKLEAHHLKKVVFINDNIFNVSLQSQISTLPINQGVFVWFSNLCFDQSTTDGIFKKIVDELPTGSIICCSKQPAENPQLLFIETIPIEMSWHTNSNVHMYRIL
jgi:tRNA G46 methylase TrmB